MLRRLRLLGSVTIALALGCGGSGGGGFTGIPAQRVPNLRPEPAADFSIGQADTGAGMHRVLRLTSLISNYGDGPMEIFGNLVGANTGQPVPAFQIIHWNNGQRTILGAGEFEYHAVHNHWHWENLVNFKLADVVNGADPYDPANTLVGTNDKVSFCLVDFIKIPGFSGPGQPSNARYVSCMGNTQGISVGWTDIYISSLFGQWIVIDGIPDGLYWVILESDPMSLLQETDEADNKAAVKIQITGNSVAVIP